MPGILNNHIFMFFHLDDEPSLYLENGSFSISIHLKLVVWSFQVILLQGEPSRVSDLSTAEV